MTQKTLKPGWPQMVDVSGLGPEEMTRAVLAADMALLGLPEGDAHAIASGAEVINLGNGIVAGRIFPRSEPEPNR